MWGSKVEFRKLKYLCKNLWFLALVQVKSIWWPLIVAVEVVVVVVVVVVVKNRWLWNSITRWRRRIVGHFCWIFQDITKSHKFSLFFTIYLCIVFSFYFWCLREWSAILTDWNMSWHTLLLMLTIVLTDCIGALRSYIASEITWWTMRLNIPAHFMSKFNPKILDLCSCERMVGPL